MTDAEYEAQKARLLAVSERWITPLGMGWWRVTHIWERAEGASDKGDDRCPVASVVVDWEYRHVGITWYLPTVARRSDEDLEQDFVHECCHILVNEMRQWRDANDGLQHEERVCTDLARAFLWVRQAGWEDAVIADGDDLPLT